MTTEEQILQELKELKERRENRGENRGELKPRRGEGGPRGGHGRGRGRGPRPEFAEGRGGAKTFRRKRATTFLEQLEAKRDSLKKQLETPELQSINQIIVGELKATESIISEFIQSFELHEFNEADEAVVPENTETASED